MKKKLIVALCAMVSVAACGGSPDPEAQKEKFLRAKQDAVNVEFNDRTVAKSVVGFRATPVTTLLGTHDKFVGSAISQPGGPDLVEADCRVEGKGYAAKFQSPATVNMPSFGRTTGPAKLTCTYKDETYTRTFDAVNLSKSSRTGTALAVGVVLCPICGAAVAVGNGGDKLGDAYGYEKLELSVY